MKKTIVTVLVLAILVGAGLAGYRYIAEKRITARKPFYTTATARLGRIESKVSASGTVEPLNRETFKAVSRDTIDKIFVKVNQTVKKGAAIISFKNGSDSITAPYDGVISEIAVNEDDVVAPGQELAGMFDNKHLITKISVDELDLPSIKLEQKAQIKVNAYPNSVFSGRVTDIGQEGTAVNGVSSFPVTITFDQVGKIRSGMTTEATIVTAVKDNVIIIPIEAIRTENGKKLVTIITGNAAAQTRNVEIGINSNTMVEIKSGLSAGDRVELPQAAASQSSQTSMPKAFQQMRGGQSRTGGGTSGNTSGGPGSGTGTTTNTPAGTQ